MSSTKELNRRPTETTRDKTAEGSEEGLLRRREKHGEGVITEDKRRR